MRRLQQHSLDTSRKSSRMSTRSVHSTSAMSICATGILWAKSDFSVCFRLLGMTIPTAGTDISSVLGVPRSRWRGLHGLPTARECRVPAHDVSGLAPPPRISHDVRTTLADHVKCARHRHADFLITHILDEVIAIAVVAAKSTRTSLAHLRGSDCQTVRRLILE